MRGTPSSHKRGEDHGERTRPEGPGQEHGPIVETRPGTGFLEAWDMHDEGIERGPSLRLEDARDRLGTVGARTQTVDGFRREGDEPPFAQDPRRLGDVVRRDQKLMPRAPARVTGKPPSFSANMTVERPSRLSWTLELRNI